MRSAFRDVNMNASNVETVIDRTKDGRTLQADLDQIDDQPELRRPAHEARADHGG